MKEFLKQHVVRLLWAETRLVLKKYHPTVIAVTGSVGKTSTKDAIVHVLSAGMPEGYVRGNKKSFNSEIGIPLTVLGLPNAWSNPISWLWNLLRGLCLALLPCAYPRVLILEVGADHPGDIEKAALAIRPDIAVVTRLPDTPVHVENFADPEAVRREKAFLVEYMQPNGVFVGNADDPHVTALRTKTTARFLSYGFDESAVIRATYPEIWYEEIDGVKTPKGMSFRIDKDGGSFPVRLRGVLGTQSIYAALAALVVGTVRDVNLVDMTAALGELETPRGRMRLLEGNNGTTLVDDSYNSSPVAAHAALAALKEVEGKGRKIAILGDMLELGEWSDKEHRAVGRAAGGFLDILVTVGKRAWGIVEGAKEAGMNSFHIVSFNSSEEAGGWLSQHMQKGDVILAKGSQGSGANKIRIERAVKILMAHPEDAEKVLVRQEPEWQEK